MRLCWRVEFPSPAMSAVALKLADCANDDGENVYPSVGRIERETRLGASTVRRVLAAFEQAGLLEVVCEASGNKWNRSTTIRRFNLAKLHDLTAVSVRDEATRRMLLNPSTHILKNVGSDGRDHWVIVARGANDKSDYDREKTPPQPEREGQENGTPPTAGGHPNQSGRPTPPTAGANPSIEPSGEETPYPQGGDAGEGSFDFDKQVEGNLYSQSMGADRAQRHLHREKAAEHGGGWAKGWTIDARVAISGLRSSGVVSHIAIDFIDVVRGTLRPQKGADATAYVSQLAHRLRDFPAPVLQRAAAEVLATRRGYLPTAADIARIATEAVDAIARDAAKAAKLAERRAIAPPSDPALSARWDGLRAQLSVRLGVQIVESWFTGAALHQIESGRLTITVPEKFKARWIAEHYTAALLGAAQSVLGTVSSVAIVDEQKLLEVAA